MRAREEEKKRQEALAFAMSMSGAIGKRDRTKKTTYNTDEYYRKQMENHEAQGKAEGKGRDRRRGIPKPRDFPRGLEDKWRFYNVARLKEIRQIEEDRYMEFFNTEFSKLPKGRIKLLSEELEEEREKLLDEGFGKWTAGAFAKFKQASAACGRDDIKGIHERLVDRFKKTEEEVRAYASVFWSKGPSVFSEEEWNKIESKVMEGEKKLKETDRLMETVSQKVLKTRAEGPFEVDRMIFLDKARKRFTHAEDAFLLCALHDYGYGNWQKIKNQIRKDPRFQFDYYFRSRSIRDLKQRCELLIRNVEKEQMELEKREARFRLAEEKRRKREDEALAKIKRKQEAIAKRIHDRKEASLAKRKAKQEEIQRRKEAKRLAREERRKLKRSKTSEQREKERRERNRVRILSPKEKQLACTIINEGRNCTQKELSLAICEKMPEKTKIAVAEFVKRAGERRKTKESKKKVWKLIARYEMLLTDEWVKEQEEKPEDAKFVSRKDGAVREEDVPVLLRLIETFGSKYSLDELIECGHEHILFATNGKMKAKIKEIAVKDKRLGQKRKQ